MKNLIKQTLIAAHCSANHEKLLSAPLSSDVELEETKNQKHGDFSTNLAMKIAKTEKLPPLQVAEIIINKIKDIHNILDKVKIAGPGFINFFVKPLAWHSILKIINEEDSKYGYCNLGLNRRVNIEFVSSNPTGPLHIGHGRGAVVGDSLANIFSACGFNVQREYYINDSGKQILTLGLSVYLRIKSILTKFVDFPKHCYQGNYIKTLAKEFIEEKGISKFPENQEKIISDCASYASKKIIEQIRIDLRNFGIIFEHWFSEQSLYDTGKVHGSLECYRKKGLIYEKNGAQWFETSRFGDEKDRVVVRKDGMPTYFASDIAYHQDKFNRGFHKIIDIWGADHHGYIPRMKAAVEASGKSEDQFKVILVRLVNLLRDGNPVAMSTRSGEFITLSDVVNEVGSDAARFLFLTRHHDSPLDFDIEIAKKKNNDNPVYYVQYVHARISNILKKGQAEGINTCWNKEYIQLLTSPEEIKLIKKMTTYPKIVINACTFMEPHRISFYLRELAGIFHAYYSKNRILTSDLQLTKGRLYLVIAVKKVIRNGLNLLGVSAPEIM